MGIGKLSTLIQNFKNERLCNNVKKCNLHSIRRLLDRGADASYNDEDGKTPLFIACCIRKDETYDLCQLLLENGADCNSRVHRTGTTPFLKALAHQSLRVVELLLNYGGDIAAVDKKGCTAMHYAALNSRVDVLEFVLDHGFDIDVSDEHGFSALFWAASNNKHAGCKVLLRRGALVNRVADGWTPLSLVIWPEYNHTGQEFRIVQLLLDYRASITAEILRIALLRGENDDIRKVLMQHVAKLEYSTASINGDLRHIIENENCYRRYYETCCQELESLEAEKFYERVSVFDILMDSGKVLSLYAKNEELVEALEERNFGIRFPIYFPRLKKRFYAKVRKQRLLNSAAKILSNILLFNQPSHPVNQNVLRYFSDEDLKLLDLHSVPIVS